MNKSNRGACESCKHFTKVGLQHNRWFLCEIFDWRSASSHTYKSCPHFSRIPYNKKPNINLFINNNKI